MNRGGAENALMNYYRHIDRNKIQFDFLLTDIRKCDFEEEIVSLGGRVNRLPKLNIKNFKSYIKSIKEFFKNHPEYRIVHSHTSSKSVIPLYVAKHCGVPIRISHSHSAGSEQGVKGLIRDCLKPLLKITANVYCSCGEQAAEWLYGRRFAKKGKVKIIRNVIDTEKFIFKPEVRKSLRNALSLSESAFVIGHVARLCDVKNHLFSIEILKESLRLRPDSFLLLVGDGPERAKIMSYANSLGIGNKVLMVGVVPNVYDYISVMDAFILPSFYEGLPLSIIEAQVSGIPCFTTKGTVSKECRVTDLVRFIPLESGAKVWAKEIIESAIQKRYDRLKEIQKVGYDSIDGASDLQDMYTALYNVTIQ